MQKYIRTNDEGMEVLDYDLLDIAARANFLNDTHRIAADLDIDIVRDPAHFDECALNDAANVAVNAALYAVDEVDRDTKNWMVEIVTNDLAQRYSIEL